MSGVCDYLYHVTGVCERVGKRLSTTSPFNAKMQGDFRAHFSQKKNKSLHMGNTVVISAIVQLLKQGAKKSW